MTDAALRPFCALRGLTALDLSRCPAISDASMVAIADSLPALTELRIRACRVGDMVLARLGSLPALRTLDCTYCLAVSSVGLAALCLGAARSSLQSLKLRGCYLIDDAGADSLASLTALTSLNVAYCQALTDKALSSIAVLRALRTLKLRGVSSLTESGLASLQPLCGSLTSLDLHGCSKLSCGRLVHLSTLTSLRSLNLARCAVLTPESFADLPPSLESLDVGECEGLGNRAIEALATALTALTRLDAPYAALTDNGVKSIAVLQRLRSLDVSYCTGVTAAGVAHLSQLTALERLSISGVGSGDAVLPHLAALRSLVTVDLTHCNVSAAGLAKHAGLMGKAVSRSGFNESLGGGLSGEKYDSCVRSVRKDGFLGRILRGAMCTADIAL